MDPLVKNDTHAIHWILNGGETDGFIHAFFSNQHIFNNDTFLNPNTARSTIPSLLHSLLPSIYANNHFTIHCTNARVTEAEMAKFFNKIIQHVVSVWKDVHPMYKHRWVYWVNHYYGDTSVIGDGPGMEQIKVLLVVMQYESLTLSSATNRLSRERLTCM